MRPDVHQAKLNAQKNIEDSSCILTPEQELLVERLILDGKRAGADLDEKKRNELMELRVELTTLENEFNVSFCFRFAGLLAQGPWQKNFKDENARSQQLFVC